MKPVPLILIVEDEFLVRLCAIEIVEGAGFRVIAVSTADEAIAALEKHDEIQLVFTDVDMPGSMNGLKLAAAVRDRWPPVKLVVTSGHGHIERLELPKGGTFLPKPYNSETLERLLHEMTSDT